MTIKELVFKAPVSLAISAGDTTPDPGNTGVVVWSTALSANVYWNGSTWQTFGGATVPVDLVSFSNFGGF